MAPASCQRLYIRGTIAMEFMVSLHLSADARFFPSIVEEQRKEIL
jgi:hypothetical protein